MPRHQVYPAILVLLLLSACGTSDREFDPGPPTGWTGEEDRWWQEGVDTSQAFRDMETLRSMGVETDPVVSGDNPMVRSSIAQSVKQSLIRMYRNQPELIDSLFTVHVIPQIAQADLSGERSENVDRLRQDGYRTLGRHFQEPRTSRSLGEDIEIVYPDSLRQNNVSGRVSMQVYISEEGEPRAIKLVDSVHPVLDDIAMKATTEMRWRPAYLLRRGNWMEIPSWARFNINFTSGQ